MTTWVAVARCTMAWRRSAKVEDKIRGNGRGDRIRTCDHLVPNQERYRAALHPEIWQKR